MRGQSRLSSFGVETDFFTVGYERLSVEELFFLLKGAGVRCLADLRANPWSNVPDHCAAALEEKLDTLGKDQGYSIRYVSVRELGNPFREDDWKEKFLESLSSKGKALEDLRDLILSCPTALICYEKDPSDCHRSILSAVLRARYGLEPVDLRA
ncbi:MAG TPA: DUF488 domain-containing protein [Methanocellaceae archaeon]|jgi:uncharacterized protein (DUF488 family)